MLNVGRAGLHRRIVLIDFQKGLFCPNGRRCGFPAALLHNSCAPLTPRINPHNGPHFAMISRARDLLVISDSGQARIKFQYFGLGAGRASSPPCAQEINQGPPVSPAWCCIDWRAERSVSSNSCWLFESGCKSIALTLGLPSMLVHSHIAGVVRLGSVFL